MIRSRRPHHPVIGVLYDVLAAEYGLRRGLSEMGWSRAETSPSIIARRVRSTGCRQWRLISSAAMSRSSDGAIDEQIRSNSFALGDENGGPFELTDSQVIECIVGTHEGIDVRRRSHARPLRDAKKFVGVIAGEIGN